MKLCFIYIHRVYIPTYWLHQFLFSQNMLLESYFFCVSHIRQSGEVIRSKTIVRVFFHCFIHYLAPCFSFVFQFALQLVLFLTGTYNFYFPLFAGSIYCTLFVLDCFDFAHGYICVCVYSIILIIICLILQLPFVWGSSLVSHSWIFIFISLHAIKNHLENFCS